MTRPARLPALLLALALSATAAPGQDGDDAPAFSTLVADRVEITGDGKLIASGNVEALHEGARLRAERIIYDEASDSLQIEGPIVLTEGTRSVILADSAELSGDLREGLLQSARVVLDEQFQLAATEINRVDGRYTQLYRTVASACEVCINDPVPLWQIRSERVIHDELERQIHFENATFEVLGVPVMYLPYLRVPDPSVERATGFLPPRLVFSEDLGNGIKVPYFITLGDSRDLLLTPYVAPGYTATLEWRYRQVFRNGQIGLEGAFSRDVLLPDEPRAYLFGEGRFDLPNDFKLDFDIETTSDKTYLDDYDYSGKDRLDSSILLRRTRPDQQFWAQWMNYESLRSDENNETQPYLVGDLRWIRRFSPDLLGGTMSVQLEGHGHQRRSTENIVGRDVERLTGRADWRRDWIGPAGLLFATEAHALLDHTNVQDDTDYPEPILQFTPYGVAEVRWPWVRQGGAGNHVIEPMMQLVWAPDTGDFGPQDESTQLEFDEGNLFSLSRFPAGDVRELGLRANVGVTWTRYDPSGWSSTLAFGRILRQQDLGQFTGFETFEGTDSAWLTAVQFKGFKTLALTNRAIFDDIDGVSKNELRLGWSRDGINLGTSYIFMEPSAVEDRDYITNELTVDGDWQITDNWLYRLDWRYDLDARRSNETRWGLQYRTECATFDMSVRQRYTSSTQTSPTTDFSFEVRLDGLNGPTGNGPRLRRPGCKS